MNQHSSDNGFMGVQLGQDGLMVDVNYSLDLIGDVQIESVTIAGHTVGCEAFADELLAEWAADITRERAAELRSARECAAFEASEEFA